MEVVQRFITPKIETVNEIKTYLSKKDYTWNHNNKIMDKISKISRPFNLHHIIYNQFLDESSLEREIKEYNAKHDGVLEKLKEIDASLYDDVFIKKCSKLISKFNSGIDKPEQKIQDKDEYTAYFVDYIINNQKHLTHGYHAHKFWERYGLDLFKNRERSDIAAKFKELNNRTKKFTDAINNLLSRLEPIQKEYVITFGLKTEEMKTRFSAF